MIWKGEKNSLSSQPVQMPKVARASNRILQNRIENYGETNNYNSNRTKMKSKRIAEQIWRNKSEWEKLRGGLWRE